MMLVLKQTIMEIKMSNSNQSKSVANNASNQVNANKGTNGTNFAYDKAQGHRGAQLNPNGKK